MSATTRQVSSTNQLIRANKCVKIRISNSKEVKIMTRNVIPTLRRGACSCLRKDCIAHDVCYGCVFCVQQQQFQQNREQTLSPPVDFAAFQQQLRQKVTDVMQQLRPEVNDTISGRMNMLNSIHTALQNVALVEAWSYQGEKMRAIVEGSDKLDNNAIASRRQRQVGH